MELTKAESVSVMASAMGIRFLFMVAPSVKGSSRTPCAVSNPGSCFNTDDTRSVPATLFLQMTDSTLMLLPDLKFPVGL